MAKKPPSPPLPTAPIPVDDRPVLSQNLPNRYRGFEDAPPPPPEEPEPTITQSIADAAEAINPALGMVLSDLPSIADAVSNSAMGSIADYIELGTTIGENEDPNFNPIDHIPPGFEIYARAYTQVRNQAGVDLVTSQLKENIATRVRQEERGAWDTAYSDLVVGAYTGLIPLPGAALRGAGGVVGALRGAAVIGTPGAAAEVFHGWADPTRPVEETVWGVAGNYILPGAVGAAVGHWTKGVGRTRGPLPTPYHGSFVISSPFGKRRGGYHDGVDIAMPVGSPVYAQRDGRVLASKWDPKGGGNIVSIDYGEGVVVTFMHLSESKVSDGDVIRAGEVVALSGSTGRSTGPHLHYRLHINGKAVNPTNYNGGPPAGIAEQGIPATGSAARPEAEPRDPAGTVNVLEGLAIGDTMEVNGRGVKVIIGPTPNGSLATYYPETPATQIVNDAVGSLDRETARLDDEAPPAVHETKTITGTREQTVIVNGRRRKVRSTFEVETPVVEALIRGTNRLDEELPSNTKTHNPNDIRRLIDNLREQADDLEAELIARMEAGERDVDWSQVHGLRASADDMEVGLTHSAGERVMGPDGKEIFIPGEGRTDPLQEAGTADLRAEDSAAWREAQVDEHEIPDEPHDSIPFETHIAGEATDHVGERIHLDLEATLAAFDRKAWMTPRIPGVRAFPENAFQTAAEWVRFVMLHESEHGVNLRMEGETRADYENRINDRAWEDLQAGKGPFIPTDSLLEKIAIAPSPSGQLARLIPEENAAIHASFYKMGADFSLMLKRNLRGGATTDGSSVFQLTQMWVAKGLEVRAAIRSSYLEYLGKTSTGPRLQTELLIGAARIPKFGTAARSGLMTLTEFRKEVGKAANFRDHTGIAPEAIRAAEAHKRVMNEFEEAGRELNMFQSTRERRFAAERKTYMADQLEREAERLYGTDWNIEESSAWPKDSWLYNQPDDVTPLHPDVLKMDNVRDAVGWVARNSENPVYKALAAKLEHLVDGIPLEIYGDAANANAFIPGTERAIGDVNGAVIHKDGQARLLLNAASYATGNSERTLIHEALHAAIAIRFGRLRSIPLGEVNALEGFGEDARAFYILASKAKEAYDALDETALMALGGDTRHRARIAINNIDEFLTYAMTDGNFADWLDTVPLAGQKVQSNEITIGQAIVNLFRKMFGYPAKYEKEFKLLLKPGTLLSGADQATERLIARMEQTPGKTQIPKNVFGRKGLQPSVRARAPVPIAMPELSPQAQASVEEMTRGLRKVNARAKARVQGEQERDSYLHWQALWYEQGHANAFQDMQPGELRTRPGMTNPNTVEYRTILDNGELIYGTFTMKGTEAHSFSITSNGGPRAVGPIKLRKVMDTLIQTQPEITRMHAYRVSGARAAQGRGAEQLVFDVVDGRLVLDRKLVAEHREAARIQFEQEREMVRAAGEARLARNAQYDQLPDEYWREREAAGELTPDERVYLLRRFPDENVDPFEQVPFEFDEDFVPGEPDGGDAWLIGWDEEDQIDLGGDDGLGDIEMERRNRRDQEEINPTDRAILRETIARWRAEAEDLLRTADEPVRPANEENYMHRYWNTAALKENRDAAIRALIPGYRRIGQDAEQAERSAVAAYERLVAEPDGEMTPGRPGALNHRTIPATNEEVWDFIEQNPEALMGAYSRRMGAAIEMTRAFGDAGALDEIDKLRADMIMKNIPFARREKALQLFEDLRDRIGGGFHGKDPMSWDNRAVRALKNLTNITALGKSIYSQTTDVARVIANHPGGAVRAVFASVNGDLAGLQRGTYAKMAGEALELANASLIARFIEQDDALIVAGETGVERTLAAAQTPFFIANLMSPFTVVMKEWMGLIAAHALIEDVHAVSRSIWRGETPDPKIIKNLGRLGITPYDAQLIASMPTEKGGSGLNLPNVMAWEGAKGQRARTAFLGAVFGEIRRTVPTPSPMDRPAIFDGVFHSLPRREAALAQVEVLANEVEAARQQMRRVGNLPDDDPDKIAAVDAMKSAVSAHNTARRNVGRAGRIEAPIASLPFQLHSFAMAAGSKVTHGLISGADRNRTTTILSMLGAGLLAAWLKADEDEWDFMGWGEMSARAVSNSSIGAWMVDLPTAADSVTGANVLGSDGLTGLGLTYNDKDRIADNIGQIAAGPGVIAGLIEPMVDPNMPWNTRVGSVRRSMPANNMLWWDKVTDTLERSLKDDKKRRPRNNTQMREDMRLDDPRINMPKGAAMPPVDLARGLTAAKPVTPLPIEKPKAGNGKLPPPAPPPAMPIPAIFTSSAVH